MQFSPIWDISSIWDVEVWPHHFFTQFAGILQLFLGVCDVTNEPKML